MLDLTMNGVRQQRWSVDTMVDVNDGGLQRCSTSRMLDNKDLDRLTMLDTNDAQRQRWSMSTILNVNDLPTMLDVITVRMMVDINDA